MPAIKLDATHIKPFLSDSEIGNIEGGVLQAHERLEKGEGPGSDFLGWLHLPSQIPVGLIEEIACWPKWCKKMPTPLSA